MKDIIKKDNRLEIIRIISIILVIVLHVTNRYLFNISNINSVNSFLLILINCITRVSVPLFFMISGIVNIPKEFNKNKYFSKIIKMIIILIVWTLVYYYIDNYKLNNLFHAFFSFLKPHLWYMYALIGLYIVTPFISKMVKNFDKNEEKMFIMLWIIICGVYYLIKVIMELYGIDTNITHPIPLFNSTYYLGYYVVGYLIYNNKDISKYDTKLLVFITLICIIINSFLTFYISVYKGSYYQGFFGYSNILIMIPSLLLMILSLRYLKNKNNKLINYICPCIFGIYLSHILILERIMRYIKISNMFLGCFAYTIITFIIAYILIFIIKKIPYINKYIC